MLKMTAKQAIKLTFGDKEKLADAVEFQCKTSHFKFAQGRQLERNEFCVNTIEIYRFGSISVPVSSKVSYFLITYQDHIDFSLFFSTFCGFQGLEHLEVISERSSFGKGLNSVYDPSLIRAREIHHSKIRFTASDFPQLKLLVLEDLQFPNELSTNVDVELEKMALYESGSFFSEICGYDDKGNSFKYS